MRSAVAGLAIALSFAACSVVPKPGCDLIVATFPRGIVFEAGQALGSPDRIIATREDIDFDASEIGSTGTSGQRVEVISLTLDADAAERFDAFADDIDGGNLVIAVDGTVVYASLPGHQASQDGVMTTHGPPSDAVDLRAVMTRCGVTVADAG
jgi:hypothetical protein